MDLQSWSTTAASNTTVDGVGIDEGMDAGLVNNGMRAIMANVAGLLDLIGGGKTTGGSSSAYTLTTGLTLVIGTLPGMLLSFEANHTNTGAATLNVDGIGVKDLKRTDGSALQAGDIVSGGMYLAIYESGADDILLLNPLGNRAVGPNAIINGAFNVAQRGTSFTAATTPANSDDTYLLDRWYLLSDGNDIVDVSQDAADVPTNGLYAAKMLVATVDKKFGLAQIIEQKNCIGLIGETVTLSFKAKVNNTTRLDKIKAGIIAWSGTADTVTSDIISAWGTDGTTPTLIANATFENTPADLGVTTSWASYSLSALIDTASAANIIIFIWSDNVTDTDLNDVLSIADVQLEFGATATNFERRPYGEELDLCRRYYKRLTYAATGPFVVSAMAYSTTQGFGTILHSPQLRTSPTFAVSAASAFSAVTNTGGVVALNAFTQGSGHFESARLDFTASAASLVAGEATAVQPNAAAWLSFDAEL